MPTSTLRSSATLVALAAVTLLAACGRDDSRSAGQKVDAAIATTERKASEVATSAGRSVTSAADTVSNQSKDMAVTAEVKARLARDTQLSALAIDVDTTDGRVLLRGTAPDTAARNHAAELARGVDGVSAVNNELNVQARSN